MMIKPNIILACALIAVPVFGTAALTGCTNSTQQESTGQYIDSSAITVKVKTALLADEGVKGLPITVHTYKNTVQLSGFVNNNSQRQRALSIARSVEGVQYVQDSILIKRR